MNKSMKKSLFLAALVLMSTACFAQKNPLVKKAKSYMMAETPDFSAARANIEQAIETAPTTETYYWAGMIGYQEMVQENYNQMLGQGVNQEKAGNAVVESYNYWLKADELAMIPTLDKKGNEVVDQKTRNNISKKMLEYYKNQELVKYGIYLNEKRDYAGAYQVFKMHIDLPELPMMQTDKLQKEMPRDTTYEQYKYYTAIFAVQAELHNEAVELLEEMKDSKTEGISINQFLYQEYVALKDTAKYVETLQNAIERFPGEPWFLQNLINHYIFSGQEQAAVDYLTQAIERQPDVAEYHQIKGELNLNLLRFDDAMADFDRALEIDPNNVASIANKGRVYYNRAVKMNEDAASINDKKAFQKAMDEMKEVFRQALPYYERALQLDPENRDYIIILKGLYYRFYDEPGMEAKYNEMAKRLSEL